MIYGMRHVENTTQTSCLWTGLQMDSLQITISQEPLWHQVVKYDIHDRKWRFCLIQVKLSAAAAHFVPITRLININQSFVTCYFEPEWMQETWHMEKEGRRQERSERRPTESQLLSKYAVPGRECRNSVSVAPLLINRWRWRVSSVALSVETRQHHYHVN